MNHIKDDIKYMDKPNHEPMETVLIKTDIDESKTATNVLETPETPAIYVNNTNNNDTNNDTNLDIIIDTNNDDALNIPDNAHQKQASNEFDNGIDFGFNI
eukprot:CAMPEP_0114665240 /NCGR_PEP_ID=MMETSP0191-20121206/30372_1 /TAXON_ID=126664 /ORGANISM="Sorites sp." /LENGTH=99 /DNA_ID=CAMNT_0001909709 /DNA_START=958 /DNA_END=1257 /DNA_ORIENTATION=+